MSVGWKNIILVLLSVELIFSGDIFARVVETVEEKERLLGYEEYLEESKKFESERAQDLIEKKRENLKWEEMLEHALLDYKREKQMNNQTFDESGQDYQDYLLEKKRYYQTRNEDLDNYKKDKTEQKIKNRFVVKVTEEQELGLDQKLDRVEWKKRSFNAGQVKLSRSSGYGGDGGSFQDNSSYDNSSVTLPPPVAPYEPTFDSELPPPPPPIFDDDGF